MLLQAVRKGFSAVIPRACLTPLRVACAAGQGVLGVFLREPLVDWQREARHFMREAGETGQQLEDRHILLKVQPLALC